MKNVIKWRWLLLLCGCMWFAFPQRMSARANWQGAWSYFSADSINKLKVLDSVYIGFCVADGLQIKNASGSDLRDESLWRFEATGSQSSITGTPLYYIRSVKTGLYVSGTDTLSASVLDAWEFCVAPLNGTSSSESSATGGQKQLSLVHYEDLGDSYQTHYFMKETGLVVYTVQYEPLSGYEALKIYVDSLQGSYCIPQYYCVAGTGLGKVSSADRDELITLYERAAALVVEKEDTSLEDTYMSLYTALNKAYSRIDSQVADVPDGYYRIQRAVTAGKNADKYGDYLCSNGSGFLLTKSQGGDFSDISMLQSVFRLTKSADGGYVVQNMYDSTYIGTGGKEEKYSAVKMTGTPRWTQKLQGNRKGTVSIWSRNVATGYSYRCYYSVVSIGEVANAIAEEWNLLTSVRWRLIPVSDKSVDSLNQEVYRKYVLDQYDSLITASAGYLARAEFCAVSTSSPLITDSLQLSCPNREAGKGSRLSALLDGNEKTYLATCGNNRRYYDGNEFRDELPEYHYLQVHTSSPLPARLVVWWCARGGNTSPTSVEIKASADGANWQVVDTLSNPWAAFPTTSAAPYYRSSTPLTLGGDTYTYLRLTVLENSGKVRSAAGYPYFSLSEFNLYPYTGTDPRSQMLRSEVKAAADVLTAALTEALGVQASGNVTAAHCDRLRAAYEGFLAVWSDTTLLSDNLYAALQLNKNCKEGSQVGQFAKGSLTELGSAVSAADALRPFFRLTRAATDAAASALEEAVAAFKARMNQPDPAEWYLLSGNATGDTGEEMTGYGKCLRVFGYDVRSYVRWSGTVRGNEQNGFAAWRFVPIDEEERTYALQNLASGWYLGKVGNGTTCMSDVPVPYSLYVLPDGKVALRETEGGRLLTQESSGSVNGMAQYSGYSQAWTFNYVDDQRMTDIKMFRPESYYIVTTPYGHRYLPQSEDATMTWYSVCGVVKENGEYAGLKLKELEFLPEAGYPCILYTGPSTSGSVFSDMAVELWDSKPDTSVFSDNGLYGVLRKTLIAGSGYACLTQVTTEDGWRQVMTRSVQGQSATVEAQSGYVVLSEVQDTGEEPDAILMFYDDGTLNGIGSVSQDGLQETVSVYTLDGVRLRTDVARGGATQGLPRGIYLVGRHKVIVK